MTPEQRLDRLERLLKACLRESEQSREQDEKLKILTVAQTGKEEREAYLDRWRAEMAGSPARNDEKLDKIVEELMRYVREINNGNS